VKKDIVILRVDPTKDSIAPVRIRIGKNAVPEIRRICRAKKVGWREIMDIDGTVLVVAAGLEVDEAMRGWRILGGEDTAGIGILFGRGAAGGMIDCPVDSAWLRSRVKWLEGEDVESLQERADTMLPMLADDIRAALAAALPNLGDGTMWLLADHADLFGAALTLGITSPSTGGQRLTPIGVRLHEMLIGESK